MTPVQEKGEKPLWAFIETNLGQVKSIARSVAARFGSVSSSDVEDLGHEAILRVLEIAERRELTFESDMHYLAWIYGVLRNVTREWIKKTPITLAEFPNVADTVSVPPDLAADTQERILWAVARLKPPYRVVMELNMAGFTASEIAALLDIQDAAVRQRIWRARQTLRVWLTDGA